MLAFEYQLQGQFDRAEPLHQQVQSASLRRFGENNPSSAFSNFCLGHIAFMRGQYDRAAKFLGESLPQAEAVYGKDHPQTLRGVSMLGVTHRNRHR
jgi:hypothetical protein